MVHTTHQYNQNGIHSKQNQCNQYFFENILNTNYLNSWPVFSRGFVLVCGDQALDQCVGV